VATVPTTCRPSPSADKICVLVSAVLGNK
jgi:hypothetical protein